MDKNEMMVCLTHETYEELVENKVLVDILRRVVKKDKYLSREDICGLLGLEVKDND